MSERLTLRQWRLAREVSMEQMAKSLDIHPNTYAAWEQEPEKIPVGKAIKITQLLDVRLEDLFLP